MHHACSTCTAFPGPNEPSRAVVGKCRPGARPGAKQCAKVADAAVNNLFFEYSSGVNGCHLESMLLLAGSCLRISQMSINPSHCKLALTKWNKKEPAFNGLWFLN